MEVHEFSVTLTVYVLRVSTERTIMLALINSPKGLYISWRAVDAYTEIQLPLKSCHEIECGSQRRSYIKCYDHHRSPSAFGRGNQNASQAVLQAQSNSRIPDIEAISTLTLALRRSNVRGSDSRAGCRGRERIAKRCRR